MDVYREYTLQSFKPVVKHTEQVLARNRPVSDGTSSPVGEGFSWNPSWLLCGFHHHQFLVEIETSCSWLDSVENTNSDILGFFSLL